MKVSTIYISSTQSCILSQSCNYLDLVCVRILDPRAPDPDSKIQDPEVDRSRSLNYFKPCRNIDVSRIIHVHVDAGPEHEGGVEDMQSQSQRRMWG